MLFISLSAILYISLYRRACSYLRLCDEKYRSEMCVINFLTKKKCVINCRCMWIHKWIAATYLQITGDGLFRRLHRLP